MAKIVKDIALKSREDGVTEVTTDYVERQRQERKESIEKYNAFRESKAKLNHDLLLELHNKLIRTCINFINKHNLGDVEDISFYADELQSSARSKRWMPSTDSSLIAYEYVPDEDYFLARKEIEVSI